MINKEDTITFNVTVKTSNEIESFMLKWVRSFPEHINIISYNKVQDTKELYQNKLDYISKNNK